MQSKKKIILTIILLALVVLLGVLIKISAKERADTASKLKSSSNDAQEQSAAYSINVFSENTDKFEGKDIIVSPDVFADECSITSYNSISKSCLRYTTDISVDNEDLLLLYFVAYADESSVKIKVEIGEHFEVEYPVTTDKTAYYIPVTDIKSIEKIKIYVTTDMAELHVGDVYLVNYADREVTDIKTGMYNLSDYDEIQLGSDDGIGSGSAVAVVADDNYLYAIYDDMLSICDIDNGGSITGTLYGLGSVRDIEFCRDDTALVITSRESDVFFVDITDVYNPELISHYSSNGMAYGLDVCGDYVFFSSRYFGTEVVDISDIENPVHVSQIKSGDEHVDCVVYENYIYISCWGQKKILVYDISDPKAYESVNEIEVDGYVYGVFVDGDYLYAATGYNSGNESEDITDCGYGGGNGMEIYNITDRESPEWISGVKTDGRYYSRLLGTDSWKVYVADGTAYLTNVVNGVYTYDVANPFAPALTAHYTVRTYEGDQERRDYDEAIYIYPYKSEAYYNEAVTDIALTDGAMYICGYTLDTYKVEDDSISAVSSVKDDSYINVVEHEAEDINPRGYDAEVYACDTPVYAAKSYEGYIYAACGVGGIHILDESLNVVDIVETDDSVRDLRVSNGYLYTAQSGAGFVIYKIEGNSLEKISEYNIDSITRICSSLELSPEGDYAVVQFGWNVAQVIDISDVYTPEEVENINIDIDGTMYYGNICNGVVKDRYIGIYSSQSIIWIDFGTVSGVNLLNSTGNPFYEEEQGIAAYGEYAVAMCNGGYVYYNPEDSGATVSLTTINKNEFKGKNTIYDGTMVVTDSHTNTVYIINIDKPASPRMVSEFTIQDTPYAATVTDEYILIPGGYSGLIKLSD